VQSRRLEGAVSFAGHLEVASLLNEIRRSQTVVLFSNQENTPAILAQAMAAGRPIVASRVGGIPEMITDGENGYLVDAGDEAALAERLAALLNAPELCEKMGAASREIARQRYDPAAVARQTVEAYRQALQP
jgi:glycosyltransferase involved in cell wall biosynthesis